DDQASASQAASAQSRARTRQRARGMIQTYIGLGANLGSAKATLSQAAEALRHAPGIHDLAMSRLYRSAPVDSNGPDYINAVAYLLTDLGPKALLALLQQIETQHGRTRPYRNAPRTLDLDLLLYGN